MKMRCSLARSLVLEPKVFLFDEPFGALDEITRETLNDELLSLFQRKGFAALFITHSISEAVFLSTRVLVMSARPGRIVGDFEVPFPYPRSPELRFEPEFAELSGEVSHALRGAHTMTDIDTRPVPLTRARRRSAVDPTDARRRRRKPASAKQRVDYIVGPIVGFLVFIGLWYFMLVLGARAHLGQAQLPDHRRRTRSSP